MIHLIILILLFAAELIYFRIANRYNIFDKPNSRSSHTEVTIRGGGIIYWFAAVLYTVFHFSPNTLWFLGGITLISTISLWDDIKLLSQKTRFFFQMLAMTLIFYFTNVFNLFSLPLIILSCVFFVGVINAYNFMDGINGITGLYSIAVLLSLLYVNVFITTFVNNDLIIFPIIASLVFLFFNFRKKAKCFAGDVGSMGIAFWIVTLLLLLLIKTENIIWIGFLLVYGLDSILTILHRLYLRQNIFEPHRLHFYQVLANEKKMSHLLVSTMYFFAQLICSISIVFLFPITGWWLAVILTIILTSLYSLKFRFLKSSTK